MSGAAWVFSIFSLLLVIAGHFCLLRALKNNPPRAPPPHSYPSVTVIRPVRGLDIGAEENVRALLSQNYPGAFELFFVLDGEEDPAFPKLQEWIGQMPTRATRVEVLLAGQPPKGQTGKLNAMMLGFSHALGDLIAFNDSDTRPAPGLLTQMVDALLADPQVGSAFAPVYAEADSPLAGDVAYGLFVNAWYGSSVRLASGPKGQMPFIMGQLMVLRREALASVGGLLCLNGQLIDDMYLGMKLCEAGWENRVVPDAPLRLVTGDLPLSEFFSVFRRWLLFSKTGLSFSFTRSNWERGTACWTAWAALAMGAISLSLTPIALALCTLAFTTYSQQKLQEQNHGPRLKPAHLWVPAVLPLFAGIAALASFGSRQVEWRGRSYSLDRGARLAPDRSPVADA